jgi:hypothetical protein
MAHVHTLGQSKGLHGQASPRQSRAPGSRRRGTPQRELVAIALPPYPRLSPKRKWQRKNNCRTAPFPEPLPPLPR